MSQNWIQRLFADRTKEWIGCIDFGTAFSKVAMVRAVPREELSDQDIRPLPIARGGSLNPFLLPSIVFIDDKAILFGEQAEAAARRLEKRGRAAFSSPKQYLSTHEEGELDEGLGLEIDPTAKYTPRALLTLYLAHLIRRAEGAAAQLNLPWPPKLRVARPAWKEQAHWGEPTLKQLVKNAFLLVDRLGDRLITVDGVKHEDVAEALQMLSAAPEVEDARLFQLSDKGDATVLEATAVAASSIDPAEGRRVVVVADIGGGTSDFAAFMTGLPRMNVVAELEGSSALLREAGDHVDMLLTRHILDKAGYVMGADAALGVTRQLTRQQRANKQTLFEKKSLVVELNDQLLEVKLDDFVEDPHVKAFAARLCEKFSIAWASAAACAGEYARAGRPAPLQIMFTGGGHSLPMVTNLADGLAGSPKVISPELLPSGRDENFTAVMRQLTVAIGGAIKDLPRQSRIRPETH